MLIKSLKRVVAKVSGKATLRTVLIVPFVLQIVGAVGLVGYLSWRNGQQAVNNVASQLRTRTAAHVVQYLNTYLSIPHLINRINSDAVGLGTLNLQNLPQLERYLFWQMKRFDSVTTIIFGSNRGNFIGADRLLEQDIIIVSDRSDPRQIYMYATDRFGNRSHLLETFQQPDVRERPWYKAAEGAGKPTWTPIFQLGNGVDLAINANRPVYDPTNQELLGVFSVNLTLTDIGEFLHNLEISNSGKIFIIDRNGLLIANSVKEKPYIVSHKNKLNRLRVTQSQNPLIAATGKYLTKHFSELERIQDTQQLEFKLNGKRQFIQITPFKDELGLDWLIVVAVPEADFMEQINAHNHMTILLCVAAFLVATGIGILTARWITKPILRLNTAAKEIAKGKWDKTVEIKRSDEVGQLAESFSQMAAQLQQSFAELTYLNEALSQSERKFRAIFNQTFQFTGMLSLDGILLEVNQTALEFGGLQRDDVIGKPLWDCYWWTICQETQTQLQAAIDRAVSGEFIRYEVDVLGAENRVITIDFSLKPIFDETGNVEFLIPEGRDITERKRTQQILADYNRTLETQVAERTADLIHINEQLKHEIADRKTAELALKQQKEILQTIFDNIPVMLNFYNVGVEAQIINKAFENTLGWSLEELREIDIMAQCYPDPRYRAKVTEFMMRADGTWQDLQTRTRTGKILFTSWANVRLPDGSTVGIGKDITERKRAEAETLRSKDLLESIFNESADAIFLVNAETLLITDCNRRAVELFEAESKDELLNIEGRTFQKESFTPEELNSIVDETAQYGFWSRELEYVTKKGKLFWGNLAAREIYVASQKMHLVRVTDITARKQAEEELRESKRFIEQIANASPHLWYIYDHIEKRNVYANRELAAVLGYTPQQMQNMGSALLPTIVHPDDFATFPLHLKKWETATDDDILEIEYRIRNAQGEWLTLLTRESVFERTPDGTVKQVIGTSTDISDLKRIEEALRENALRERAIATVVQKMRQTLNINTIFSATTCELRQVLNCDRVAIYRFNPDWSGEFVAESVAKGWVPLIVEQKNDPHLTEDALEDSNCIVKTLNIDNDSVQDTYLQDTRGGAYSQGVNYRVTQDIYKAGFTPCYINLLERFQARAYIIVPIFCGSQLWGLLATYQNCSPRAWSESQITAVVQIGVQLGVALQQAHLLQHTQQQAVALELALDELKRTQAQLIQTEKMSSLGRMVAGVAHEINNPVSFIYGNLAPARHYFQDLLSLTKLYQQTYPHPTPEIQRLASDIDVDFLVEDWQKLINSIQIGAERIREIVLSLKNFSRLDEKDLKTVDIHEGIDNTLLILQHRLKADGVHPEIKVIKNYGQLPLVTCYASQLNQVFMNLLSNAIDALETQLSPRKITISTSVDSRQSSVISSNDQQTTNNVDAQAAYRRVKQITNYVVIRITDNGAGMSEAVKEKIFDPFFTTKPVGSGTGLGLSISYQIVVEKHQGQISCISTPGKGTEFIVEIPVSQKTPSV